MVGVVRMSLVACLVLAAACTAPASPPAATSSPTPAAGPDPEREFAEATRSVPVFADPTEAATFAATGALPRFRRGTRIERGWTTSRNRGDGLIEAWRSRKQLRDPLAFGAWFRTIVLRKALKRARKTRRVIAYTDERVHEPDPGESYALRRQVLRALAQLDSGDRVVIVLQYYLGFTQQEAAVVLKIPTGTVKSRTHRAMDRLRAAFDAEGRP